MKKTRAIGYLTMMLILLQSFSMVANSLDIHIVDLQSLQHEHSHILSHENIPDGQHNSADCHICGHCSGTHAQWLSQYTSVDTKALQAAHQFYYLQTKISSPVNQLLRPPKA